MERKFSKSLRSPHPCKKRILHETNLFTENGQVHVEHIGVVAGVDLADVHI